MYTLKNANESARLGSDEYFKGSYWENEDGSKIPDSNVLWVMKDQIKATVDGVDRYIDVEPWK